MTRSFDYIVIGGGVMGASILFQLGKRRAGTALMLEQGTLGFGSTGRSSGVIRMHYSTEVNTRLSWESLDTWRNWSDVVGHGDAGRIVPPSNGNGQGVALHRTDRKPDAEALMQTLFRKMEAEKTAEGLNDNVIIPFAAALGS